MINLFDDIPARSADEIFTQVLVRRNGGVNASDVGAAADQILRRLQRYNIFKSARLNQLVYTAVTVEAHSMGELTNPRYERFAQELAAGNTADGAYEAAGYRKHRGNAARLSANERIKNRVREIQAVGAEYAAVTLQSLIDEAEQARVKAMESPNGAAAAVSAITAKAKLAGLWHEKVDQHNTGSIQYERIERVIVEHTSGDAALSDDTVRNETTTKAASGRQPPTRPGSWSA